MAVLKPDQCELILTNTPAGIELAYELVLKCKICENEICRIVEPLSDNLLPITLSRVIIEWESHGCCFAD